MNWVYSGYNHGDNFHKLESWNNRAYPGGNLCNHGGDLTINHAGLSNKYAGFASTLITLIIELIEVMFDPFYDRTWTRRNALFSAKQRKKKVAHVILYNKMGRHLCRWKQLGRLSTRATNVENHGKPAICRSFSSPRVDIRIFSVG